jgi:HEAT repeat protein
MRADIDAALIALFEGQPGADERLIGFGPDAFHRVMSLYREWPADFPKRLAELISELKRESIDCWTHAISVVAWANPGIYVDQLAERPGTLDVVILGTIDDPRVVGILRSALGHDDWLVRYHAVRSLAARPEVEARQHLQLALTDDEEMVRGEARAALDRLSELP